MTKLGTECPVCGADGIQWKEVKKYRYTESGLDDVWLLGGVRKATCGACHKELTHIEQEWQLLQVIAIALLHKEALLIGPETRFLREAANLTQEGLATLLHFSRQATISDRERKREPVMSYAEDLGFRILILSEFLHFLLKNHEENFLTAEHVKILRNCVQWLAKKAHDLKKPPTKKIYRLQRSDSTWRVDLPLAA